MARITILTFGSRGDVQPFCAIALELLNRGHEVTLAGSEQSAEFVGRWGIPFQPIPGDIKQLLSAPAGLDLLEGNNQAQILSLELYEQQLRQGWHICQGSDLLLLSSLTLWGYHLAEALQVPAVLVTQFPISTTRAFPFLKFASRTNNKLAGLANLASYRILELLSWQRYRKSTNRFRQEVLNIPSLPWLGTRYRNDAPPQLTPLPVISGYSAAVLPNPKDFGPEIQQTDYCWLDTAAPFMPTPALTAFLEDGPPPFYVGFGSMTMRDPQRLADTVLSALAETGQRAVLASGWGNLSPQDLPPSVYQIDEVPHDWLFPKMRGAIHHGGAGTTATTLKAGIPSIVVPFFADQPAWGQQLENLGISPTTIPRLELSHERLAVGIRAIVDSDRYRTQAQQIQRQLQQKDGVGETVDILESYLSVPAATP
ncbi:MAG: glycosyltransferase [Cyanobacteria bacterium P01_A01_bin.135]